MPLLLASASAPRPDLRAHRQTSCSRDSIVPGQPRVHPAMMHPAEVVTSQSLHRPAQEPA